MNSNQLKLIAIATMTIDHLTWVVYPGCNPTWWVVMLHMIGRITAPIMWFFIAEGYYHTKNLTRYALRLFAFAVISHFAYCFAFGTQFVPFAKGDPFSQTSVIWGLFCGLLALEIANAKTLSAGVRVLLIIGLCAAALPADWSCISVFAILAIGLNRGHFKKQMCGMMLASAVFAIFYFVFIDTLYGFVMLFTGLAIPLLYTYNGQRGKSKAMKWVFYLYYPLHLALCGVLRLYLQGYMGPLFWQ